MGNFNVQIKPGVALQGAVRPVANWRVYDLPYSSQTRIIKTKNINHLITFII